PDVVITIAVFHQQGNRVLDVGRRQEAGYPLGVRAIGLHLGRAECFADALVTALVDHAKGRGGNRVIESVRDIVFFHTTVGLVNTLTTIDSTIRMPDQMWMLKPNDSISTE